MDFDALDAEASTIDDERDWLDRRDQLAIAWVADRAQADRRTVVLRLASHAHEGKRSAFRAIAERGEVVTNRGKRSAAGGATLVPHAYPDTLAGAMDCASGTGIVVTEHPAWPVRGWAMALGALNLRTLKPTVDERTDEQRDDLDHLMSMLTNGWRSDVGRRAAQQLMPKLAESGMSWPVFFGSVLAADPYHFDEDAMKKHAPQTWQSDMAAIHDTCMRHL